MSDHEYRVYKRFHKHVRDLFVYLLKTIGVDHFGEKKEEYESILGLCKRPPTKAKAAILHHWLRKIKKVVTKQKQNKHHYENAESF